MRYPAVVESLELAADLPGDDMQDDVYRRLFASHPEFRPLFGTTPNPRVLGEMLARACETILDLAEDDCFGSNMIKAEAANHTGFEVAREVFPIFFQCVGSSTRAICGARWTSAMDEQWRLLLGDIALLAASTNA